MAWGGKGKPLDANRQVGNMPLWLGRKRKAAGRYRQVGNMLLWLGRKRKAAGRYRQVGNMLLWLGRIRKAAGRYRQVGNMLLWLGRKRKAAGRYRHVGNILLWLMRETRAIGCCRMVGNIILWRELLREKTESSNEFDGVNMLRFTIFDRALKTAWLSRIDKQRDGWAVRTYTYGIDKVVEYGDIYIMTELETQTLKTNLIPQHCLILKY